MPKGTPGRAQSQCHPEKTLYGRGLCHNCWRRDRYQQDIAGTKAKVLASNRLRTTGWTADDYEEALREQGGRCAICGETQEKPLAADHDHKTRQPRGLLCDRCNMALGLLRDDPELARAAADYLEVYIGQR